MLKASVFIALSLLFLRTPASGDDGANESRSDSDTSANTAAPEGVGMANAYTFEYADFSGPTPILHTGELTIPIAKLLETSQWEAQAPAISARKAIELAESELNNCQFLTEQISWILTELLLVPYRKDKKAYWCWVATFNDPNDVELEFKKKVIKIAVLLNGETIAPTFKKFEINDPLLLIERIQH